MATKGIRDIHSYMASLVTGLEDFSTILKPVRAAVKECAFKAVAPLIPLNGTSNEVLLDCYYDRFKALLLDIPPGRLPSEVYFEWLPEVKPDVVAVLEFLLYKDHGALTMPDPDKFRHGIYDHFKGGVYKTNKLGFFANGETYVDYVSLNTGNDCGRFLNEWCEIVKWPDGKLRSRYVYRGKDLAVPEPAFKVYE